MPQGSVLDPLLFNIYLNDLLYLVESTNVYNFVDNTTFYGIDKDLNFLINAISANLTKWSNTLKQFYEIKPR